MVVEWPKVPTSEKMGTTPSNRMFGRCKAHLMVQAWQHREEWSRSKLHLKLNIHKEGSSYEEAW